MSDYDDDNICGFDMDHDGDKDFYDDLLYDDCGSDNNNSSGWTPRRSSPQNRLLGWFITFIVLVILITIVNGSFDSFIIVASLICTGIIWFFKNLMSY